LSRVLARCPLVCHPQTACAPIAAVGAEVAALADGGWQVTFVAVGTPADLALPQSAPAVHTDELWRTTCFELFIARPGDAYVEINLSPSGAFAVYRFDHYRTGMTALDVPAPAITVDLGHERLTMIARLAEDALPWDRTGVMGISAVIADRSGCTSYWALAHPPAKPDFHHRDCFALSLPPVDVG
jgi:hypothetical protein